MNNLRPGLPSNPRSPPPVISVRPPAPEYVIRPDSALDNPQSLSALSPKDYGATRERSARSFSPASLPPKDPSSSSLTNFPAPRRSGRSIKQPGARLQQTRTVISSEPTKLDLQSRSDNITTKHLRHDTTTPRPPGSKELHQEIVSMYTASTAESNSYNVWNRVADAASSLTINVSKAWASTITSVSGEETPPGQDSHLTRALKAYHISKAQDVTDLPGWLFTDRERRAGARPLTDDSTLDERTRQVFTTNFQKRPVNDEGASAQNIVNASHNPSRLRGADRLKAMRDMRRGEQSVVAPLPSRLDTK